jgi:hypothetical protein
MLKGSGVVVVDGLTVVAGCYEACLMLRCFSVASELENNGIPLRALTVRDRMTSWWLVELLISWAIKSARPDVPVYVRGVYVQVMYLLVEWLPYLLLRCAYC